MTPGVCSVSKQLCGDSGGLLVVGLCNTQMRILKTSQTIAQRGGPFHDPNGTTIA